MGDTIISDWEVLYQDRRDKYGRTILLKNIAARVLFKDDQNPIFKLIENGVLEKLYKKNIIQKFTFKSYQNYPFSVISQNKISTPTVPAEWSYNMLIDAALLTLKAERELIDFNMTIDDVHPWNILFDGSSPYLIDLGAFNKIGNE